jgi:hypothetical protein
MISFGTAILPMSCSRAANPVSRTPRESSPSPCRAPLFENPFGRFGDHRNYVLAPDGSFEDPVLSGWQLSGATRVTEADPV